tara:strand:- start:134 stop:2425 length:2292 start_codon:yes stop_codon:yes gene_type:complete
MDASQLSSSCVLPTTSLHTALLRACATDDGIAVTELLARGADVNGVGSDSQRTPIACAVEVGAARAAQVLMNHGAHVDAVDIERMPPSVRWAAPRVNGVYDVIVIGAGAAGIGVAAVLRQCGAWSVLVLDRHHVGASFERWPDYTRFITPSFNAGAAFAAPDLNAVDPFTSPLAAACAPEPARAPPERKRQKRSSGGARATNEHPSGVAYAAYLRSVVERYGIAVWSGVTVTSVARGNAAAAGVGARDADHPLASSTEPLTLRIKRHFCHQPEGRTAGAAGAGSTGADADADAAGADGRGQCEAGGAGAEAKAAEARATERECESEIKARYVVWACGEFQSPNGAVVAAALGVRGAPAAAAGSPGPGAAEVANVEAEVPWVHSSAICGADDLRAMVARAAADATESGRIIVVGASESGVDVAAALIEHTTCSVVSLCDGSAPWRAIMSDNGSSVQTHETRRTRTMLNAATVTYTDDDPSCNLAPKTLMRLRAAMNSGRLDLVPSHVVRLTNNTARELSSGSCSSTVTLASGATISSAVPTILATGFSTGRVPLAAALFDWVPPKELRVAMTSEAAFATATPLTTTTTTTTMTSITTTTSTRSSRSTAAVAPVTITTTATLAPVLTEVDESRRMPNVFMCGPSVRHRIATEINSAAGMSPSSATATTDLIFCFVYKFRTRFAVVANVILKRLAASYQSEVARALQQPSSYSSLPAAAFDEDERRATMRAYTRAGMYLDDLRDIARSSTRRCGRSCGVEADGRGS